MHQTPVNQINRSHVPSNGSQVHLCGLHTYFIDSEKHKQIQQRWKANLGATPNKHAQLRASYYTADQIPPEVTLLINSHLYTHKLQRTNAPDAHLNRKRKGDLTASNLSKSVIAMI